jgi:hypothetical protein
MNKLTNRSLTCAFVVFILIGGLAQEALAQEPLNTVAWQQGYTLIVTSNTDVASANQARDYVISQGGKIAILLPPHIMLGWVSPELAAQLIGKHGIESVSYNPVDLTSLRYRDEGSHAAVSFFNAVVSGTLAEEAKNAQTTEGLPLANDAISPPPLDYKSYKANLDRMGVAASTANSDSMTGTVALTLFFVESTGAIDSNSYTWDATDQQNTINRSMSELSWWSNQAPSYNQSVNFSVFYYSFQNAVTQQGYEPVLHSSSQDGLWINQIMANLGYTSGEKIERVTAFNTYMRSYAQTNWAYSAFIAYNPASAPDKFTDGYFAYAHLGGPYTQLLFRNGGWSEASFGLVLTHETGHIFWACDEYNEPGYAVCSCSSCGFNGPRPNISNGNCEACNPNSVACMMKTNAHALCSYTAAQIGWTSDITIGQGAPNPQLFIDASNRSNFTYYVKLPPINVVHRWNCTTCDPSNPSWGKGLIQDFNDIEQGVHDALMLADTNTGFVLQIYGGMWDKFNQLGGLNYYSTTKRMLGYPIADRNCSDYNAQCFSEAQLVSPFNTSYHYQRFQGGALVLHKSGPRLNQTFEIHGPIRARWQALGGPDGSYGLPISDEYISQTKRRSDFEGGSICFNPSTNQTEDGCASTTVPVTVQTSPVGRSFTVDGTTYTTTRTFNWSAGSSHSIGTSSPQSGGAGVQYVWSKWSDNGAIAHNIAPSVSATYTATFNTVTVPAPTTTAATFITNSSATLNGSVNPKGAATNCWFEWGTSSTLATFNQTPPQAIGAGTTNVAVNRILSLLNANTRYYFRVVGANSLGTSKGAILSFLTGTTLPPTVENVVWANATGVSISGNNLTKTATTLWGNAGASSTRAIASGNGYVEFTAYSTNTYRMCGLSKGDSDLNFGDIDFALYAGAGGIVYVYEKGVFRGQVGSYAVGDVFRVSVESGVVRYRKNGILLYQSTVAPVYPLLVDTSLYSTGAAINNTIISGNLTTGSAPTLENVVWASAIGVSISGNNLTKTATTLWGNAGASSTKAIASGNGYVEFTANSIDSYRMCGLSNGDSDLNFGDIDFALYAGASGKIYVYEKGVFKGLVGSYIVGDVFRVSVESGVVRYRKNGILLYQSTASPAYPLLVDTSLYSTGAAINNAKIQGILF